MNSILEKSVPELEIDDGERRMQKHRLTAEKQALQAELSKLKAQCAVRLPQREYQRICRLRADLVNQLTEKETEIAALNAERAELTAVMEVRKHRSMNRHDIRQLVEIRDRWHGFSMDGANHQKAREVAWKISQELREVLKRYFDANAE